MRAKSAAADPIYHCRRFIYHLRMLSVLVLFRNAPAMARQCLLGLFQTFQRFQADGDVEFIFIDDCSAIEHGVIPMLQQFRSGTRSPVQIIRFKEHRHYAFGLACGFSLAQGSKILFVSHDMMLTAPAARMLLQIAATDESLGVVRPTSRSMDGFKQLTCDSPLPLRSYEDILNFSEYVSQYYGTHFVEDPFLIGDAMLVRRSVIDKIGIPDPNYVGFYGDLDYGLRIQRAGFKLATARGAWVHHEGSGGIKEIAKGVPDKLQVLDRQYQAVAHTAYLQFCQKWDPAMSDPYLPVASIDFARLRGITPANPCDYQPPIQINPAECERF
ncbi:MAG: glycosyltransferase [Tepidisphaeraceae bacterium]